RGAVCATAGKAGAPGDVSPSDAPRNRSERTRRSVVWGGIPHLVLDVGTPSPASATVRAPPFGAVGSRQSPVLLERRDLRAKRVQLDHPALPRLVEQRDLIVPDVDPDYF